MIDQPCTVRADDTRGLLATGTSLAVSSAAAHLLSDRIALGPAAPDLLCFEGASSEQLARLRHASDKLARTVVAFLEAVDPELATGARERMALAAAEATHVQSRAREAAQGTPARVAASPP